MMLVGLPAFGMLAGLLAEYLHSPRSGWILTSAFLVVVAYTSAMLFYQWATVLSRLKHAGRSQLLWSIGLIALPLINFFMIISLGFIKAPEDQSKLSNKEKIFAGLWVITFTSIVLGALAICRAIGFVLVIWLDELGFWPLFQ